jgi:glutaryl-CoA dehydrogenase
VYQAFILFIDLYINFSILIRIDMRLFGPDFYNITELLTEEETMIQRTAFEFVQTEFMPLVHEHYEKATFPLELAPKLGEMGFMGSSLPEESGGSGVSNVAYGLILHELERGDSGLRSFASVQGALVMYPIHAYGSDEQRSKWLPGLGAGTMIGCFGLTEPNFGSNPGGMATRCKRDGDDWIINGNKMWITNGTLADVALVWARDDDGIVRGFLLEKGMDGFTSSDIHGKLSLRASITSELSMSNVRVPDSARLPNIEGLKGPLSCLTQARYGIAWGMVGAAVDCYNTSLEYSKERKQFSKPIAGYQLTQAKFAEMITRITESQLLVYRLGRLKDEGKMNFQQVSMAKRNNCAMARDIAKMSREILGANGVTEDYSPIRHMANIESVYTYEGTHEMHTLILGQEVTGIPAYDS